MLKRVAGLFQRYAAEHGAWMRPGFELCGKDQTPVGRVESHGISGNRYIVSGWVEADEIGLALGGAQACQRPGTARAGAGFVLDLPLASDRPELWILHGDARQVIALEPVSLRQMRRRLIWPFMRDLTRALPAIMQWFVFHDPSARAAVKQRLGLETRPRMPALQPGLFQSHADVSEPNPPGISLILPVYNAFDLLAEVLGRVTRHTDLPWRLIVIEDGSSDERVRPWLRQWHAALEPDIQAQVTLLENEENQGFIRSVNQGFDRALPHGDPVVLLNSDALVPPGWASRLIRPLIRHEQVASVTPMSNDAEIFTAPVICARADLAAGQGDAIDGQARRFNPDMVLKDAPTGVGFCMAMHIEALRQVPQFDTGFGRGYGEEVDWCRKLAALGWRHLGHGGVFVAHRGGASFGTAQKRDLVQANNRIISRRYPGYDQLVQDFIRVDPLATPRLALALVWAGQGQAKVPVYLAHDLGGGAEHYLQRRIAQGLDAGQALVVLRVGGARAWQIELHSLQGRVCGETDDADLVRQLLQLLPHRAMIYSCGVGAADPLLVPRLLTELGQGGGDDPAHSLEIQFHDYWPISPSYTLLSSAGAYDGLPDPARNTDRAHEAIGPGGVRISLAEWQQGWGRALAQAKKITVFCDSSKAMVAQAYPQVIDKIDVIPHHLLHNVPRCAPGQAPDAVPVIGVLGNIGVQKGAAVLRDLSRYLAKTGRARLVLIGNLDPNFSLVPPARVHGHYEVRDLPGLINRYGISNWLIPSIWPETFSYATHEAIATGLPVWSFDLGAQAQAVKRAAGQGAGQGAGLGTGLGGVIPLPPGPVDVAKLLDLMLQSAQEHA